MKALKSCFLCFFIFISTFTFADSDSKCALVAGGGGFLGSHLCERLLGEGYTVICLDNFSTGNAQNVAHLQENPNFFLLKRDICEQLTLDQPLSEVYNLACPASPPKYQTDPIQTLKTNFLGTLNLLELAKTKGATYFQASTSEVYGDPAIHPQVESYWGNVNPIGPRACYDEGKRVAETLCFEYNRQHNLSIKVARIFNTYGPRMSSDDGRVVSNFVVQAISGQPITVYGDGTQTRSFCYVDDLITGFRKLMQTPGEFTGPVNLGNPEEVSMQNFASMVTLQTQSNSKVELFPLPQDDPTRRKPDISQAQKVLDWTPQISMEEGLKRTIEYFSNLKN